MRPAHPHPPPAGQPMAGESAGEHGAGLGAASYALSRRVLEALVLHGAVAGAGAEVVDVELELLVLVHVTGRLLRFGVEVVDGVRVEGGFLRAAEDVVQAGGVR